MPLAAYLAGERIEAPFVNDADWEDLRGRCKAGETLTMSCGQPGKPRISKNGLKHFYHHGKTDCSLHPGGESADHLEMKSLVAAAAREAGWDAVIEQAAPDRSWIADVMVTKGTERWALEIQFSRQDAAEFRRRQERYEAEGIRCFWLVAEVNRDAAAAVPSALIGGASGARTLSMPGPFIVPVIAGPAEAINNLLNHGIKQRIEPVVRAYSLETAMIKCWRESCKRWITAWRLESLQVETRCGYTGSLAAIHHYDSRNFLTDRIERLIADKVMPILKQADLPAPMFLATRFSKAADRSYLAYCCPFCNSLQGDTPLNHRSVHWRSYVVEGWLPLPISQGVMSREHLCVDVGRGHCSQEPQATPEGPTFPDGEAHWVRATPELLVSELPPLPRRGERKGQ